MSNTRTGSGTSRGAPSKSAIGRRGDKAAIGGQGEKAASVKTPKPALAKAQSPKSPSNRAERTAERREAIIEAALDEFISRGFTATRIDDVARRAGVAKGTIYLHFKDKESMFEELIRTALVPLIGRLHAPPPIGGSVRDAVEAFARTFIQEVASTRRGDIVRLIVAEGPRFPSIADFYYREVVSRGLAGMRALIELAVSRGEIQQKNLAQGWVEADMIFVSPDESGRVIKLDVREGDEVKQGAPLYSVDDDLQKADLNQNNATLANAQQTYDRAASLNKTGSGTQANLDSAVSALRVAEARVNTSQTRLTRRSGFAPVSGTIQQIYFREGEMVPAQRPVLSIMPPGNMKVRFYVPEPDLPKLAVGDEVRVTCDNCAGDLTAKIYFIATSAEYTPPVIYSLDERNKLVYLIQARPSRPDTLRVGQPISVFLGAKIPVADKR